MKTTIYLHVGMHKTGTSSIQATFFKNRPWLLRHDVNYLSLGENHSGPVYSLVCDRPHLYAVNRLAGIDTPAKAEQYNTAIDAALTRDLTTNECSRFIISGENLSQLTPAGIARLKKKLESFCERFHVIVYVREPYSFVSSAFQEKLRAGATYEQLIGAPVVPRYSRIQRYIDLFGRSQVDIRIFDAAHFPRGDLIADFMSAIHVRPQLAKRLEVVRANAAISYEAALVLNEINKAYPSNDPGKRNPNRARVVPNLLRGVAGQPFRCPMAVFMSARPAIIKELRWLRSTLGEQVFSEDCPYSGDLTPAWSGGTLRSLGVLINDLALANAKPAQAQNKNKSVGFSRMIAAVRKYVDRVRR